jgi:hypothetical protein
MPSHVCTRCDERISLSSAGHHLREGFLAWVTEVAKNSLDASLNAPPASLHASAALLYIRRTCFAGGSDLRQPVRVSKAFMPRKTFERRWHQVMGGNLKKNPKWIHLGIFWA